MPITWKAPLHVTAPRPSSPVYLFSLPWPLDCRVSPVSVSLLVCPHCSQPLYCFLASTLSFSVSSCGPVSPCFTPHRHHLSSFIPQLFRNTRWLSIVDSDWGIRDNREEFENSTGKSINMNVHYCWEKWLYSSLSGILVSTIKVVMCFLLLVNKKYASLNWGNTWWFRSHMPPVVDGAAKSSVFWDWSEVQREGSALHLWWPRAGHLSKVSGNSLWLNRLICWNGSAGKRGNQILSPQIRDILCCPRTPLDKTKLCFPVKWCCPHIHMLEERWHMWLRALVSHVHRL